MRFQREITSDQLIEEVYHLLEANSLETKPHKDLKFKPNLDGYKKLEAAGSLRVYTIRDAKEGDEHPEVVGIALYFVNYSLHYGEVLHAYHDLMYVKPEYRGVGLRFKVWCDEQLKLDGVAVVYESLKLNHGFGKKLESIGYRAEDTIYTRRLQ